MVTAVRGHNTFGLAVAAGLSAWLAWGTVLGWTYPPAGPYGTQAPGSQPGSPPGTQPGYPPGYQPGAQFPYQPGQMPPQGQYGQPQGQAMPWQFRPAQPDNSRGSPPAWPVPPTGQTPGQIPGQGQSPFGMPGQYPGQMPGPIPGQPPSQASPQVPGYQPGWPGYAQPQGRTQRQGKPPRLEWSLDENSPYVQQNLLLRLRLISADELTTADPDISAGGDVLLSKVAGPTASNRGGEQATEFVLSLTPLRPGSLEVPAPKVTGTRPGNYGSTERYEAVAQDTIRLQVRPAMPSVRPWLPLQSLSLNASIDHPERVEPGQPVTLVLEMSAAGAGATQLPSLEDQLTSPDFRIYREQTLTDTSVSRDGRQFLGKRTEYYTLVPQSGGTLRLPEIKVPWWDVAQGVRQVATLPIRTLSIQGAGGPFSLPASLTGSGSGWGKVWLPIAAVLLVLAGYWGGVLYHRHVPGEGVRLRVPFREALRGGAEWLAALAERGLRRLDPAPLLARGEEAALTLLPESSRFLICVRHANQARDPFAWCERFEQSARRLLRVSGKRTIPKMTERILDLRPRADRARLARLMDQLDAALYGRQSIDFPRWKREFMGQVGRAPALLRPRRPETRIRRATLPALNPRVFAAAAQA